MKRTLVFLAAALFSLPAAAAAQSAACGACPAVINPATTDWYVDPVGGLDQDPNVTPGAGSKSMPFFRLSWAVCYADDNDRIFLLPGIYSPTLNGESYPIQFGSTCSMLNIQVIGVAGAASTILDGENTVTSASGILRFRLMGTGGRLSGVTVRDYAGTLAAIRLGSTTAGFETHDVEIENCVIENSAAWGIGTFGPSGALGPLKFHDNLFVNCATDGMWLSSLDGTGGGVIFNNTVVGCNNGIRLQGGSWTLMNNNLTSNAACGVFDFCDPTATACASDAGTGCPLTFALTNDYNNAFGNTAANIQGFAAGPNGLSVDPLYVSPGTGNYHLQATSPLIDAGTTALPPQNETDGDRDPRALDGDGNFSAIPDIGYDEVAKYTFVLSSGAIKQGSTASFALGGPVGGIGNLFLSCSSGNLQLPICGNVLLGLIDPCFSSFGTAVSGGPPLVVGPIPVTPVLTGLFIHTQAVVVDVSGATITGCQTTNLLSNQL